MPLIWATQSNHFYGENEAVCLTFQQSYNKGIGTNLGCLEDIVCCPEAVHGWQP
jgi:hypothetical protein